MPYCARVAAGDWGNWVKLLICMQVRMRASILPLGYCQCRRCYQSLKSRVHAERMARQTSFHAPGAQLGWLSSMLVRHIGQDMLQASDSRGLCSFAAQVPACASLRNLTITLCLVL